MPPVRKEKPIPKPAPAVPNIPGIKPYEEKPAPVVPGIEITSTEFKHLPLKPGYAIRQIKQGSTIVKEFYVEDKQSENLIPDETPLEVKLHNLVQELIDFLPDHRDKTNQLINELNKSEGELFYNQIMNKLTEIYSLIRENPNTPREVLSTILSLSEDYLTKDRIHLKSLIDSLKNEIVVKNNTIDIHNQRILSLENRLKLISIVERLSESEESNIVDLVIRAVQSNFPVTNQNDYGCTINSRGIQTLVSLDFKTVKIDFSFNKADKNKVAYLISLPGTLVQKEKSPEEIESALYQEIDLTCRNLLNLLNEEKEILPSLLNKTASKTEYLRLNETLSNYTSLEQGISNFRENQKNHPETFVGLRTAVLDLKNKFKKKNLGSSNKVKHVCKEPDSLFTYNISKNVLNFLKDVFKEKIEIYINNKNTGIIKNQKEVEEIIDNLGFYISNSSRKVFVHRIPKTTSLGISSQNAPEKELLGLIYYLGNYLKSNSA